MDALDLRPTFHEGQYLGADDLTGLVAYLRGSQARHALGGHTWGIAIGLALGERATPGGPERVEVLLQPGYAWDGFGRALVNGRPTRLSEELFAEIPFHPQLDDVAGGGKGRLVEVWLAYDETRSAAPAPGFEACIEGDQHRRIGETFRFEVGPRPPARQRSPLTIGASTLDATLALRAFDPAAALLHDASVPHQSLPLEGKPPRWLVPIGLVRWVAREQALGYFARRELEPADRVDARIRAFRRYVGCVAESIEAADGAIVLRHRGRDPSAPHGLNALLSAAADPRIVLEDLAWIEGNLRVVGDAKLCARTHFRDADGGHQGTPFYLVRRGDDPPVPAVGMRELCLALGPRAQADNRLVVGCEEPPAGAGAVPAIAPQLVVVSSGDVGIGSREPAARLHVVGARVRLQDVPADPAKKLDLRTDGTGVGVESSSDSLSLRAAGPTPAKRRVLVNAQAGDGAVGLRVSAPQHDVDAKGRSIKLGLEEDGGGQIVLTHAAPSQVTLEARDAAGAAPASELRLAGPGGTKLPRVACHAERTWISDHLSVGVPVPAHDVDVRARTIKLGLEAAGGGQLVLACNANDNRVYLEGFSADGAGHASEVLVTGRKAQTLPRFTVRAATSELTGDVGIGTANPAARLHVAGAALRVDCPGNERAVLTGEGQGAVVLGSLDPGVRFADMRRLAVPFSVANDDAWLDVYCRSVIEVSDERAKRDVRPIVGALERVARLRGVAYEYATSPPGSGTRLGMLAQEVREVVPEAVPRGERTGVAYSSIVPLLVEAVKELTEELRTVKAELKRLAEAGHSGSAPPQPRRRA